MFDDLDNGDVWCDGMCIFCPFWDVCPVLDAELLGLVLIDDDDEGEWYG